VFTSWECTESPNTFFAALNQLLAMFIYCKQISVLTKPISSTGSTVKTSLADEANQQGNIIGLQHRYINNLRFVFQYMFQMKVIYLYGDVHFM
jgi:hypothetical protein